MPKPSTATKQEEPSNPKSKNGVSTPTAQDALNRQPNNTEAQSLLGSRAKSTTTKTYQELYDAVSVAHKKFTALKRETKRAKKDWHLACRMINYVFHEAASESE